MRILILHSRYLSGDVSGENRVVEDEARLLSEAGHDVLLRQLDPAVSTIAGKISAAGRSVWAQRRSAEVAATVSRARVDVVHAHNLFPEVSPAVLPAARRAGAGVVLTLHNYRLLCLPATLQRSNRRCDLCVGKVPWRGVVYGCYRGSRAGSAALATSLTLHRRVGSFEAVGRFLAVSDFVRRQHLEAGIDARRIEVKENFAWPAPVRKGPGSHFLFLGRLAPEKGVATLLEAWRVAPDLGQLLVAGDGPDADRLRRMAPSGVRFLGSVPASRVQALVASASAVLVPSTWPEPAVPRAVLEAYASGVGVVASAVGGLLEGVREGVSGYLASPTDAGAWVSSLRRLTDARESMRLGEGATEVWRRRYAPEVGLHALERVYGSVVGR